MSLTKVISGKLPLTVHDYMQICLQHPEYGYYRKAQAIGKQGDFTTAPEISQIFGDLIGMWLRDIWQKMAELEFHLVELGAGRGTLSADVLRMLPECSLHLVESNSTLRKIQADSLSSYNPKWYNSVDSLPSDKPLFIMANEFFDAFPIRQWVGNKERRVVDGFEFSPEGQVTREESPQAKEIMQQICAKLKTQGGVLLMVDYGYIDGEMTDTLQAVKDHKYHNPLADCGEADLTSHVDFSALRDVAKGVGCFVYGPTSQENFLRILGGDLWLQKLLKNAKTDEQRQDIEDGWLRLISPTQMGSLFKVMAVMPDDNVNVGGFI